ncbi:Transcriptional regulator GlxA family, contains an amidase domain and an AraC-type DNA-binding HTH domain [Paracoccus aminovorans]|uniref:Transcriptional regulator GlxA family, contains an amidase domain and an AraC-type DNA-binding HTH domain n=2 Tax=Paracoccus aminovorans TaxID=34004 RepID=A0A1I3EIB5_9RHOB|nr:helix-turn-helix domain-containing protein [Paracoccus aminovorans]CQR84365.1 transcriptional regulator [Paracoccus aminovorans]SFH98613.1 Transcriptional regulator GlxA family, contains an amidase domain and an AraC-type DNA-binding HTH domain [Paracoccus aminovorans]
MHRVVFILYPGFELLDMAGPASVFNGANRALGQVGRAPLYQILLASPTGGDTASSSGISVQTARLDELRGQRLGTLLIVGAESGPLQAAMADPDLRGALPGLTAQAERFGSVCSGGMVLAGLGLLDGCRVATHWDACAPFQAHFPGVSVDPEALYVRDGRLWTSAGVTTGIDMALAMVACDLNAGVAAEVAQRLVLYARRPGHQSQFSPLLSAQARGDSPFADLIGWIQANLHAPLDVPALAARAGLTERSFHRKFTAATGQTPAHFVETLRLDAARMLLSRGLSLKQVSAQVGLFPTARFSRLFQRRFGITPGTYGEMHRVEG